MPSARWYLGLIAVGLAGAALASGPRIAIAPIKGEGAGRLGAQLEAALCTTHRCASGLFEGGRVDLAKARRGGAEAVLLGSTWRERSGRILSIALFTSGAKPARTWTLTLGGDGLLPEAELARLAADLDAAVGVEPIRPAPEAVPGPARSKPPAKPSPSPAPTPTATPAPLPAAPPPRAAPLPQLAGAPALPSSPVLSGPVAAPRDEPPSEVGPTPRPATAPEPVRPPPLTAPPRPWFAVELGSDFSHRELSYPADGTAPIGYAADLLAAPRLRLELRPFRADGPASGATLFADGTYLGGIRLSEASRTHQATFVRARAGLAWRLPLASWLLVEPAVAYELERFTVDAAGGATIAGLPDTRLAGLSAALGLEFPIAGSRFTGLALVRFTSWLEALDLAGRGGFFPGGSAVGLEAEAGAAARLVGPLSLRLVGAYEATRWSLDADPGGAYSIRSAQSVSLGGRLALRIDL